MAPAHSRRHKAFGRAVRETRARRGLTQETLGFLAGLHRNYPRVSFFQLQRQRAGTVPRMQLIAHEDVLVFRKTSTRAGRSSA